MENQRSALDLLARHRRALLSTARRISICDDDADDALQRAALILLAKGSTVDPRKLATWMFVVTRREALAVRRERERELLTGPFATAGTTPALEPPDAVLCGRPGPAERYQLRERVDAAARALAALKPAERRAVGLQAAGCSYAEIAKICGWSHTKVNRSLAEGRARLPAAAENS